MPVLGGVFLAAALCLFVFSQSVQPVQADNFVGDFSTTTSASFASGNTTIQLQQGSSHVLDNIVITATSSVPTNAAYPQITVYDASSTMATTTAKVLAKIGPSNNQLGTYQFEAAAGYGIKLEVAPGYTGNATITWH